MKRDIKHELNLVDLIERHHSEDVCRQLLEELRWPDGIECPRCGGATISRIKKRNQFDCDSCRYQFSVTSGTVFHKSKLPLWKWFLAVYTMVESQKGVSANQIKRELGVTYKTAWFLCHRVRAAVGASGESVPKPSGVVQMSAGRSSVIAEAMGSGETRDIRASLMPNVADAYHALSPKHLDAYLDELEWRFNNRRNPYLFRDTLKQLVAAEKLEYKELTA